VKNSNSSNIKNTFKDISKTEPLFFYHQTIDTIILGDINADNTIDTAIITSPIHRYWHPKKNTGDDCKNDNCTTIISFNNYFPDLKHDNSLGCYRIFATEDLNMDGIKEIALIPYWFQSNWQGLFVYSLINGNWRLLGSGSVFTLDEENYEKRIRKISKNKFEIISMEWNEDGSELIDIAKEIYID